MPRQRLAHPKLSGGVIPYLSFQLGVLKIGIVFSAILNLPASEIIGPLSPRFANRSAYLSRSRDSTFAHNIS